MFFVNFRSNGIDGFYINQTYQVKTETVNVIFVSPVTNAVYKIFMYHVSFRSSVVSTDRTIRPYTVSIDTAEVAWYNLVETEGFSIIYMIVHDIHNNTESVIMKRFNHLLHFGNTNFPMVRVCGERTFRCVKVNGIITPVILRKGETFIRKAVIIYRKKMDMCNT